MSALDTDMSVIQNMELTFEKEELLKQINTAISEFDTEIGELQKEKYRLESDIKQAEMKLIIYYEELIQLNGMEERDNELTEALAICRQQKGEILKKINSIAKDLKDRKEAIDEIKAKEEALHAKFHEYCPEGKPYYDLLLARFKKITKKRRNRTVRDDEEEGDDQEENADDDDFEDEDEDDKIGGDANIAFSQEEHHIDEIDRLRDDRMKLYEEKMEIEAYIKTLEQNRSKLDTEERRIKADLEATEEEI